MGRIFKWGFRLLVLAMFASSAWYWLRGPEIPGGSYLVLDASGSITEGRPADPFDRLLRRGRTITDITDALRKVRHDGRIRGVLVRLDSLEAGWAQAEEIRSALSLVKAQGKRVVAQVELELAPASRALYVASVADKVYVTPGSAPLFTGLAARAFFLGGVWPKLGIDMHVEKIREYKSAGDEIGRESMSDAQREMLNSLLDDLHAHLVRTIAGARNLTVQEVEAAIEAGPSQPDELVRAGLVDAVKSPDEILRELGGGKRATMVSERKYSEVTLSSLGLGSGPKIAVVHAAGAVQTGTSPPGSNAMGSRTIAKALADAASKKDIAAIVLRVASPGGSPAASDEVWLAVRDAAKEKPVFASLGDVAASGGYYMASAAQRIVAAPATMTGSIGVVFIKPDVTGLLEKAGIHTEAIQRGRFARMYDLDKPFDDEELARMRRQMDGTYALFLERVAEGRGKTTDEIDRVGGGRVWTGQQAFARGLVDELGTLVDTVRAAAHAAGIQDSEKLQIVHYPKGGLLAERLGTLAVHASASMQPPLLKPLADSLEEVGALLAIGPGIQAVAETIPSIE